MSPRLIGIGLLLIGSEIIGIFAASAYYRLFLKSVPPMSMSALNMGAAHGAFIFYGVILGVIMAAFSLVAVGLARFFRPRAGA